MSFRKHYILSKNKTFYGIDISKDKFDVYSSNNQHSTFSNDYKGYKTFVKELSKVDHLVMEATGYYHYKLAYYLRDQGYKVYVENPLQVKRFIQMKLTKIKTDKSDAKLICSYAQHFELEEWRGHSKHQQECLQILRLLDQYWKQSTALKNKIHGEEVLDHPSKKVDRSLKRSLKHLQKEILYLETELQTLVKDEYQEQLTLLESIPGLGRKTATMFLVLTDGFTACKCNAGCKALYDRIVAKGKSKKLALLAVCNKLLKQAFAIAKSGVKYDATYRSTLNII